ncbi:MAG: hypothetical protein HY719_12250 [Planctomycetes bacterium]|nr:hypothetical protein [Planctomycetota bacterium]
MDRAERKRTRRIAADAERWEGLLWRYVRGGAYRNDRLPEARRPVWDYFYYYLYPTAAALPHHQEATKLQVRVSRMGLAALAFVLLALAMWLADARPVGATFGVVALAFLGWMAFDQRRARGLRAELAGILRCVPPSPTDQEIEGVLRRDIDMLTSLALERVDLSRAELLEPPIVISSAAVLQQEDLLGVQTGDLKAVMQVMRAGAGDGRIRFAACYYQFIFITPEQLSTFACLYDHIGGKADSEITREFFLADVVSATTTPEKSTAKLCDGAALAWTTTFQLTVASGDSARMTLLDGAAAAKIVAAFTAVFAPEYHARGIRFPASLTVVESEAERAIHAIRSHLRRKRGASQPLLEPVAGDPAVAAAETPVRSAPVRASESGPPHGGTTSGGAPAAAETPAGASASAGAAATGA